METHYITFHKWIPERRTIRLEFVISNCSREEARTIAKKEVARLLGYQFLGVN